MEKYYGDLLNEMSELYFLINSKVLITIKNSGRRGKAFLIWQSKFVRVSHSNNISNSKVE
jgi:hypothetical protein